MARRRIKVADFRGEPVELEMPDGTVYLIRGDMPMEIITFMADLEERAPVEGAIESETAAFTAWLEDGRALLQRIVREGSPEQRDVTIPEMSPHELMGVLGAMIGGESVGMALAEAMNAGIGEAMRRKREAETDPTPPTPSPRPSRRRVATKA